jgi:hypothetical protein
MKINIISNVNGSALIEWLQDNDLHRGRIPSELIVGDDVEDACLSLAIPYGVDWEMALQSVNLLTAADYSRALHANGLWTEDDVIGNPGKVHETLRQVLRIDFQTIAKLAHESKQRR